MPGPPKIDWDDAFAYYVALGPRRSFRKVAARFSVSPTAVRKHAHSTYWPARAKKIDREAARRVERQLVRSRADRVAAQIRVTDSARIRYEEQLLAGDKVRGSDVAALARVEALLEGEATERFDAIEVQARLREFFDGVFRFIPDDRQEEALSWLEAFSQE